MGAAVTKKPKYKSDAFESIHDSAKALLSIGGIDKDQMRKYDEACLVPPSDIQPDQIKKLRELNKVSQAVFAGYLNTSEATVQKWETGAQRPSGAARELLAIVKKHGLKILA